MSAVVTELCILLRNDFLISHSRPVSSSNIPVWDCTRTLGQCQGYNSQRASIQTSQTAGL